MIPLERCRCRSRWQAHIDCLKKCLACDTLEESMVDTQRLGSPDAAGGSPIDSLGGGGTFLASTLPNLAMSVPLAELRLRQQRKERADAAALRARASSGVISWMTVEPWIHAYAVLQKAVSGRPALTVSCPC